MAMHINMAIDINAKSMYHDMYGMPLYTKISIIPVILIM